MHFGSYVSEVERILDDLEYEGPLHWEIANAVSDWVEDKFHPFQYDWLDDEQAS